MKCILGKKIGMARIFDQEGRSFAVTKIAAFSCKVSQIKDKEKDKYKSIQITAYKKKGDKDKTVRIAEFREDNIKRYKVGDPISTKQFNKEEIVSVEGVGKGKGFAGTIKRHSFAMGPVTHGSKNVRKPGSIGGGYPERVVKGRKMAGRMGGKQVTVKNLKIIDIEDEILLISGAIPGPNGSIVKVYGKGEKAEEVIDHTAEEEKLAQEKMLEAEKEAKEEKAEGEHTEGTQVEKPTEVSIEPTAEEAKE